MSKLDKAITKLTSKPRNFTWDEAVYVMSQCGFTIMKGKKSGGSRRRFVHTETKAIVCIHEPHPRKELLPYQIDNIIEGLKNVGSIK